MGLKQVVHILRDARGISAVLSYTLPKGEQEVCTVLVLEQKVDLINEDEGVFALGSVLRNTVQDRVKATSIPMGISCLPRSRMS